MWRKAAGRPDAGGSGGLWNGARLDDGVASVASCASMPGSGFDRRSVVALGLLVGLASSVGYRWSDLVDLEGDMDWLLAAIWIALAALIVWNVSPRRDLVIIATGLCGGGLIEWWGTSTGLWSYFTRETPPLWILPAWPCAALGIDRLGRLLDARVEAYERSRERAVPEAVWRAVYFTVLPAFVVWMVVFLRPAATHPASVAVVCVMVAVVVRGVRARRDVTLFVAGSALGLFLEYWGTSRECWTYYTAEVPPVVAVFAHGFAAVAFARVADVVEALLARLGVASLPGRVISGNP